MTKKKAASKRKTRKKTGSKTGTGRKKPSKKKPARIGAVNKQNPALVKFNIENSTLFRGIAFESVVGLLENMAVQEFKQGETIVALGQPHQVLYLVLSGRLNVYIKLTLDPVVTIGPGEFVGEMSIVDGRPSSAHVVADTDGSLLCIERDIIWKLVDSFPSVAHNLLSVLVQRMRHGNSLVARITDGELEELSPEDLLEPEKESAEAKSEGSNLRYYEKARAFVAQSFVLATQDELPDIAENWELVEEMLDLMTAGSELLLLATDRSQAFSMKNHCVNVTILATRIAQTLGYKRERQIQIGISALLHEIGVVKIPRGMTEESGAISPELRQRPTYGAEILGRLGKGFEWLAGTVEQVYEREDGTGTPKGLSGDAIRPEAKILGIADVFEACIHDRPFRKALTGYQLMQELTTGDTLSFSFDTVKAFLETFTLYPYNEYVILSTGEIGRVVEVNSQNATRPTLELLYNQKGQVLKEPQEMDLVDYSALFITQTINVHNLP